MSDFELTVGPVVGGLHSLTVNHNYIIADPVADYVFKINNLQSIIDSFEHVPTSMHCFFGKDRPDASDGKIKLYDTETQTITSEFLVSGDDISGLDFRLDPGHRYYLYIYAVSTIAGSDPEIQESQTISFDVYYNTPSLDISSEISVIRNAIYASEIRAKIVDAFVKIKNYISFKNETFNKALLKIPKDVRGLAIRHDYISAFTELLSYDKYIIDTITEELPEYLPDQPFQYDYLVSTAMNLLKNDVYVDQVREDIADSLNKIVSDILAFDRIITAPILSHDDLTIYGHEGTPITGLFVR